MLEGDREMLKHTRKILTVIIGQLISAITFRAIIMPNNLLAGGFGGLAIVANKMLNLNIQLVLVSLCVPIIIWAYLRYERKLIYYAAFNYFLFTILIGVVNFVPAFETDTIVAAIVSGVMFGISGGIIIRAGVANGPECIVGMYLKEKKGLSMGNFFTILNSIVLALSLTYGNVTLIIYSIISIYIAGKVTDYIILGTRREYCVNIISENFIEITEFIHNELKRGVTFVPCVGTYKLNKKMMIKVVVTNSELIELKNYVASLEDNSFVYVTESIEVIGGGFTD